MVRILKPENKYEDRQIKQDEGADPESASAPEPKFVCWWEKLKPRNEMQPYIYIYIDISIYMAASH